MKKRLLMLALVASLIMAALPAVASAQDIPDDLEDQPIACTEGVDCPGDPRYVPLPGKEPPDPLPKDPVDEVDEVLVAPPGDEEPPPNPDDPNDSRNLEQPEVALPPEGEVTQPKAKGTDKVIPVDRDVEPKAAPPGTTESSPAQAKAGGAKLKQLPATGGVSLLGLGGSLLVVAGLLVRRKFAQ